MVKKRLDQFGQFAQSFLVDNETVQGVANTDPARLSIADDGFAHIQVAIDIKIGIDNACSGFYDRNTSGVAYKVDEAASTTRYA